LQQMDGAVVGVDDEFAVGPVRVFVSADQKFQGEVFEDEIVCGFEFIVGKWTEDVTCPPVPSNIVTEVRRASVCRFAFI